MKKINILNKKEGMKIKMKKKIIIGFIILFCIILCIVFIVIKNNVEDTSLQTKTEKQIEYLEEKLVSIMNSLNQITLSDSVLIKEKSDENTQKNQSNEQSNNDSKGESKSDSEKGSDSGSSSSSNNSESNKENSTKGNVKYETVDNSVLVNKNQTIDWDYIKSDVESIHSTWANLTIDLHSLNVNNQDILSFSDVLDQVTLSANKEDKTATLNNLASLYAFFPNYINQISKDDRKINLDYVKACILNSYALLEQNKWDEMKMQIVNAINYFTNVLNSVNEEIKNENNFNKIYVLLNELNNSIDLKDKDLYKIKYRNVMEELANI